MPTRRAALVLTALLLAAGGCAGRQRSIVNGPIYPARPQTSVANVHVIRDGTTISLTNTTASPFTDARLWANQWYSHELPLLEPGKSITLSLADFKDRYGNPFRAGGFWAPDNPERLVLMQVEQGDKLTGLVVIGQSE
ncbi:MAG TPA: hypothetical protein VFF65_00725 [Phycisphaerales bacterium]|nr:hypothetical protein [Phycisphaerales bacterium]